MISDESEHIPASMREAIIALPIGDSFTKCLRIPFADATHERIKVDRDRIKNTLNAAVRRARVTKPHDYTIETGSFNARSAILVLGVVTRLA